MKIKSVVGLNLKRTNRQKIFMVGLETISRGDYNKKLMIFHIFIFHFFFSDVHSF